MPNDFIRDQNAERFTFGGIKTNDSADALPPGKFPIAINVRGFKNDYIETRPGMASLFAITTLGSGAVTDLRGYTNPFVASPFASRILARTQNDQIYLDTGVQVGTLAPSVSQGASMIPFRPNASPEPWMYVANGADYQKFSAPDAFNVVTKAKVGIAEPQAAPDAAISMNSLVLIASPGYTQGGTAGAPGSSNRVSDTAGVVLQDPTGAQVWTIQVGSGIAYQKLQQVTINSSEQFLVIDVFVALPASLTIQSIFYFSGTTGRCVIVPAGVASESENSIFKDAILQTIRRGTMIVVGTEKCYVWSVSSGPNGGVSIETSTTGAHTTADAFTTVPAISVIPGTVAGSQSSSKFPTVGTSGASSPTESVWTGVPTVSSAIAALDSVFVQSNMAPSTSPGDHGTTSLTATGYGFAIPGGATILGIQALVYWSGQSGAVEEAITLLKAGVQTGMNKSTGAGIAGGAYPTTYGSASDLWGAAWTPADINNANFGVFLAAANNSTVNFRLAEVDTVNIFVYYTSGGGFSPPVLGQTITDPDSTYQVTMGIGTMTSLAVPSNPFNLAGVSFQTEDYISLGLKIDTLANLTEMKFLLDVDDASFTKNFYYYTVRPSDITAAVANTNTQLGTSQTVAQRAGIDAETNAIAAQAGYIDVNSGAQLLPGSGQWTQIIFPITALIRVGNDQTKSLQTLTKIQFLWNASGTINVATDLAFVFGGFQADTGDTGDAYTYRVRPRAQSTGVVGNPSPATRYGVSPRRGNVTVYLPSATYDPQIDTWDVFRMGGAVTEFRFIGTTPSASMTFTDNFDDAAAETGDALDFDNFEPWPSVDVPNAGTATSVTGTTAIVNSVDPDITSYLPGTLVQLGGANVYTLWARPLLISGTSYLLQFVENAGAGLSIPYIIQEPFLANRHLPYMWGPDAQGTVFACGDSFRPGSVYFAKNYAPDSAPDSYNQEITQPSEPLMSGETLDGLAYVASTERWWALYPQPENTAQRYSVVQQPIPRGLAGPFGHCTDGQSIYFWAKDGIWSTTDGSLTDADLYTLFPHESVPGADFTYGGQTIKAPNYAFVTEFRLAYSNGFLYALYLDNNDNAQMLVCNLHTKAWGLDSSPLSVTAVYHVEQRTEAAGGLTNPVLLFGVASPGTGVVVAQQTVNANDVGNNPIACVLSTREDTGGDVRAPKQWGDFFVDTTPAARGTQLSVTPMSLGAAIGAPTTIPLSSARTRSPIAAGGPAGILVSDFMGLLFQWTDDFSLQSVTTKLRIWQPSYTVQPPGAVQWTTFGTSFGLEGYMHIRQLLIAYVSTAPITLTVTPYDGQVPAPITLPSTGGAYQRTLFPISANKGQLYRIQMTSSQKFQIFSEDSAVYVGGWGRQGPYLNAQKFGGSFVQPSPV